MDGFSRKNLLVPFRCCLKMKMYERGFWEMRVIKIKECLSGKIRSYTSFPRMRESHFFRKHNSVSEIPAYAGMTARVFTNNTDRYIKKKPIKFFTLQALFTAVISKKYN